MRLAVIACCGWITGCLYDSRPLDSPDAAGPPDANPSARVTDHLIGLWLVDENGGSTLGDSSGLPAVAITITDVSKVVWMPGALAVPTPVDINTGFGVSNRLSVACKASDQVTLEAWVTSAVPDQTGTQAGQPAHVLSFAPMNASNHQITLGQLGESWAAQVRTTAAAVDAHGGPILASGTVVLEPTHLVVTSDATGRRFYIGGALAAMDTLGGTLDDWEQMRAMSVAGDPNLRNPWLGTIHLVAMYDRALTADEVSQNFRAGSSP